MPVKGGTMSPETREKIRQANLARSAARTHKICPGCRQHLPLDDYGRRRTGPVRSRCRPCERADSLAFHYADKTRAAARQRRTHLRLKYGLTVERYDELLTAQGGGCAICRTTTPGSRRRYFAIDHDHATGAVRALLCIPCNTGLGHLGDDPERLLAAAAYLTHHLANARSA